uniref:RNase III domain-containing protein n=1 Tax=Physcomitrium patens TaxID=3218 RepID=A0A7I4BTH1_PHYPA
MIQGCGGGIGATFNPAWLHVTARASTECSHCFMSRRGLGMSGAMFLVAERVYESPSAFVSGRARRSGFCTSLRRVSRNSQASDDFEPGSIQDRGLAVEVNDNVSESKGVYAQGSGNLNCQKEQDMNVEARTGSLEFDVKEDVYWRFDGFNYVESLRVLSDVTEEEMGAESTDMSFLSRQLVYNSQGALSNGQVGPSDSTTTGDNMDPLGEWLQLPCEPERWWRIPDLIHEVLPLPKNFNLQLKILSEKLGSSIHSRELLLRILVHKSYYLSKMPQSMKENKLRKPLMSWQRSETMDDDNLMSFSDAHGEARLQLALVGDTVLNLAASLHLIRRNPLLSTGLITERRSQLVCNSNLARVWCTLLDLRELVLCDPPFSQSKKPSATTLLELQMKTCADTLEAYIGGLYVEKGLESALKFVETRLLPLLLLAEPKRNPVALLHERCVLTLQEKPDYKIRVYVKGLRMSTGIGKSQKLARRDAAEKALLKWPEIFGPP